MLAVSKDLETFFERDTPTAVVVYANKKGDCTDFEFPLTEEMQFEWKTSVLPKIVVLYLRTLLPQFCKSKGVVPTTLTQADDATNSDDNDEAGPSNTQQLELLSPTLRPGKMVQVAKRKEVRVIKEIDFEAGTAILENEGSQRRGRAIQIEKLQVVRHTGDDVRRPTYVGQKVKIIGGKNPDLVDATGSITALGPVWCQVQIGKTKRKFNINSLAAIGDERTVTVAACNEPKEVPLDKFVAMFDDYLMDNIVLVGDKETPENFLKGVELTFKAAREKSNQMLSKGNKRPQRKKYK